MRVETRYISERGGSFTTPEEAIEHDKGLPRIIKTYQEDLGKMLNMGVFCGKAATSEDIEHWKNAIERYRRNSHRQRAERGRLVSNALFDTNFYHG